MQPQSTIPERSAVNGACPRGSFIGIAPFHAIAGPAWCKSWSCERCSRRKAKKLAARIAKCDGTRLLTLTMRLSPELDRRDRLDSLNCHFRNLMKRLRRHYPRARIRYVKVVEWTKNGQPHLHIVLDSPYIPQSYISYLWKDLTGSPIVDIRRIRRKNGSGRYLAKYLTKSEEHLANRRRWAASPGFLPQIEKEQSAFEKLIEKWAFTGADIETLEAYLSEIGFRQHEGEVWILPGGTEAPEWWRWRV